VVCSQTGDYEYSSGRVNFDEDDGTFDNLGNWPEGFSIYTDGTNVSWKFTPFMKDGVLQCLKDLSVIVKGGNAANVYTYSGGETEDCDLVSPVNASGRPAGLSNLTLCYNLEPCDTPPSDCWTGESATGLGSRFTSGPNTWFQWNTRAQLINGVDLVYGRDLTPIGRVTISDPTVVGGNRTITVTLNEGIRFAEVSGALKVIASNTQFTRFSGFSGALSNATINGNTATISVPDRAFYFVHGDIERIIECPVED